MIYGQEVLINKINNLTLDDLPRSIIFQGRVGSGRHSLSRYIADKFNLQIEDISTCISLEKIEEINTSTFPKVYTIDSSIITVREQNILLKLLEEPLKNTYLIIMCINTHLLKPTIVNRCQIWNMQTYKDSQLLRYIPDSYDDDRDKLLSISRTPGQVIANSNYRVSEIFELCGKIFDKIHVASIPNTLSISSKLSYKNSNTSEYSWDIFISALVQVAYENCLKNIPNSIQDYILTEKLYNDSYSIGNVDRRCLLENYLIALKLSRK